MTPIPAMQAAALTAEDRAILEAVHRELDREGRNGDAPGHCHAKPGIWDSDNGERAGKPCAWCLTWRKFTALIRDGAASPVAAAPQGDAMDAARLDWLEAWHNEPGKPHGYGDTGIALISRTSDGFMLETEYGGGIHDTLRAAIDAALSSPTLNEQGKRAPGLRWQEDMRERLDEATKHLQANRWTEGFQSVQDALGLLDALGERGAVSPSCD